jgi:hypothetical protein
LSKADRLLLIVVGVLATWSLLLPSSGLPGYDASTLAPWSESPTFWLGTAAAVMALASAVFLMFRVRDTPGASELAWTLGLGGLAFGIWTADARASWAELGSALLGVTIILLLSAFARFWLMFPSVITRRQLLRRSTKLNRRERRGGSRSPGRERRAAGVSVWLNEAVGPRLWSIGGVLSVGLAVCYLTGFTILGELVFSLAVLFVGFTAVLFAVYRFETSVGADRRRVLWVYVGLNSWMMAMNIGVAFILVTAFSDRPELWGVLPVAVSAGACAFVLSVIVALFGAGAFDPQLAMRRTTIVGVVSVLMIFTFGVVETMLGDLVVSRTGLPSGSETWISGGVLALLFGPLRSVVDRGVDRWTHRNEDGAQRPLNRAPDG